MRPNELNSDEIKEKLKIADDLIREGKIFSAPQMVLEVALLGLCDQRADGTHSTKEINKGILFTSILMERRSRFNNGLIIALAVIAILVGFAQLYVAWKPANNLQDCSNKHCQLNNNSQNKPDANPSDRVGPRIPEPTPNQNPKPLSTE